jgi:hypothetical protein
VTAALADTESAGPGAGWGVGLEAGLPALGALLLVGAGFGLRRLLR